MFSKLEEMWFVHLGFEPPLPLKLERTDGFGARVIGGKTGSHLTGHGETYWDKVVEVVKMGFVPVDVAQDIGRLSSDWTVPSLADLDYKVKEGFYVLKR
ncbi:MAG: hypothetical protein ACR2OZ_04925 [Verrucomicrobiales bacterium]